LNLCLAAGVVAATGEVSHAAKLPEWAVAVAADAPLVEETEDDDRWRVLLSETAIAVRPDGTFSIRRLLAGQVLKDRVSRFGLGGYHFDDSAKIRSAKAWHLQPGGNVRKSRHQTVDLTIDDSFLTDQKTRVIAVGGLEKGSLVFFQFEAIEALETLTYVNSFHEVAPVDLARFEVEVPPGWEVRHDWLRTSAQAPVITGNKTVWELRDLDGGGEGEPLGESTAATAPWLVLTFLPPEGARPRKSTIVADWVALADWYAALAAGRHAVTPEIEAAVGSLPRIEGDVFQQIRAVGLYARDSIRYLAREIGIGGYQPRPASQVLHEKLGDCKDKGTLFRALLAARGIDSYGILINATKDETVSGEVPAQHSFNHFVVGVALPSGVDVPASFRPATIELGGLGRLVVVDTTDEWNSIGSLAANLAGKRGLLVAGEHSRLVTMPDGDPAAHRVECELSASVGDGGVLEFEETISRFGEPAGMARAQWRQSPNDYRRAVEQRVRQRWTGAEVETIDVDEETEDGRFVERVRYRTERPESDLLLPLFPDALDDLPRVPLLRREQPVVYPHAMTLRYHATVRGIPEHVTLPVARELSGDGWTVTTNFGWEGREVRAKWKVTLARRRFALEQFDELRSFWDAARQAGSVAVPYASRADSP
jgi:hypothetical protein